VRLRDVGLVAGKELRETLRDRRTLLVMILFPLVVYPVMSLLIAEVAAGKAARGEQHPSRVAVTGPADVAAVGVTARRLGADSARFAVAPAGTSADVAAGKLDALVAIERRAGAGAKAGDGGDVRVLYDQTREESDTARERLEEALPAALPEQCRPAFAVRAENVAAKAAMGGHMLSNVLPMMVVVMVMIGAFYPAIDITAGERERGTLETILSTPVDRFDLMAGKVLAVSAIAAVTGVFNLASISLTTLEGVRLLGGKELFVVPWSRALATLTTVVPSAFLFASVMVTIGATARNFKEAQNLLTPVYFLCITPALVAGVGGYPLRGVALVVPAMNVTLLARDLVLGQARVGAALVVIASTLIYGALTLTVAARLYDSERMLYADDTRLGLRAWLRRLFTGGDAAAGGAEATAAPRAGEGPTAGHALVLFGLAYVLLFFVFFPIQARHLERGLVLSEWGGLLGLVVVYARATGQRLRDVLVLRRPPARALIGAALIGLSAWAVVGMLAEWIAPAPHEIVESLRRQIVPPGGGRGLAVTILLMAVTPAVCEEALFRGPILRGLAAQLSPAAAAIITGILFGLFHFDVWRLLPTGLLGVILSFIALRSGSIVPAMLAHAVNNACLVTLAHLGLDDKVSTLGLGVQVGAFAAAAVILAAGVQLVRAARPNAATQTSM
jgi:sodium transport system permease protein